MSGWGVGWLLPELDVAELNCAHLLGLSCHPVAICSDAGQHWGGSIRQPTEGVIAGGPANQLPAQVSTGPYEHLLLIPSIRRTAPKFKPSSDNTDPENGTFLMQVATEMCMYVVALIILTNIFLYILGIGKFY